MKRGKADSAAPRVWWRPDLSGWWIGVLFAVGSACFALAAITSQWASAPRPGIGVTFFVGSIFFTAAAYLQFSQAAQEAPAPGEPAPAIRLRPSLWAPRRVDWLAGLVQFAGTIFFNVSTFAAMRKGLTAGETDLRVWTPDVFGSICFLVASELALAVTCNRWICIRMRSRAWRIAAINMLGSVAFGVSAVASLVDPKDDQPVNAAIANATTTLGALCFLAGALMLLPQAAGRRDAPAQ